MIPKIIHQTYHNSNLPTELSEVVNQLKANNPDWEYRFYTDIDIDYYILKNFTPEIYNTYQSINPVYGAAKADLFRYLVLYQEGGVYLDIKSTCLYPLSQVLKDNDKFLITQWQNNLEQDYAGAGIYKTISKLGEVNGEYQQWVLAVEKHSPIMKAVIDEVINNINTYRPWKYKLNSYGKNGVLIITGPIAYTKAVYPFKNTEGVHYERYDKNLGFIYNALPENHVKVFKKHYSRYKQPIVQHNFVIDMIYKLYILGIRSAKNILRIIKKEDL